MKWLLIVLCTLVAVGRFLTGVDGEGGIDPKEPIHWERWYIDFSHLIVFGMLGAAALCQYRMSRTRKSLEGRFPEFVALCVSEEKRHRNWLFWTALGLTAIEVAIAVAARKFPSFTEIIVQLNMLAPNGEGFPIF